MHTVKVEPVNQCYTVQIGAGLLQQPECWQAHVDAEGALIVSNEVVAPLYLSTVKTTLDGLHIPHKSLLLQDGERFKTVDSWQQILNQLVAMQARRGSVVIALGGGVVGDIAGFAAASYMRGIKVLQVPTTLLAQVDAAIGGKTGFNLPAGKNLVGAFHQPCAVIMDTSTLASLPLREYRAGLAEVIKYAMIMDADFFNWLQQHVDAILARNSDILEQMITRCAQHKATVVSADQHEQGRRALLNFGHTFGHALETLTGYQHWLHGEAVAIGMLMACHYGEQAGITESDTGHRLQQLLLAFEFNLQIPASIKRNAILDTMQLDKKNDHRGVSLILLDKIGSAKVLKSNDIKTLQRYFPNEML